LSVARAAAPTVDRGDLLDGEDPDTLHPHDAVHWVRVYEELLRFKTALQRQAELLVREASPTARSEITHTDLPILDARARRLQERLRFWKQRAKRLGNRVDGHPE
jgi:hypothetical protein